MEGGKANLGPFTNWLTIGGLDRIVPDWNRETIPEARESDRRDEGERFQSGSTGKRVLKTRTSNQWYYTYS